MTLQKFGRYEIVNVMGQGGMAEVYAARDPQMDRLVALKIIRKNFSEDERFRKRFLEEAKTIAGLEHRAILPVHDFGQDENTQNLYLVMRLMPDVLNKRLEREGAIPLAESSLILNRLAVALNRAHSEKIVHRDIKPANILLDEEGTVFLADFGLAAHLDKIEAGFVPQSYGGSPFYMAPEQWRGETVGPYTDIYQLGVTLFEMLTGQRPFPEADHQTLLERHLDGRIPHACDLNPRLPQQIQPILEKAMAKSPADRYVSALELANDMANLLRPRRVKRRYEIREELQHGRFAIVYQAQDLIDERLVALKVFKQPLLANHRYRQEFLQQRAQILRLPNHPGLVPVYEVDVDEERPFVVMKFVEGASLRDRFRKESAFSVNRVCEIAESLAEVLDALHANGQVHGDINMGNILINANGHCLLADFHMTAVAELTTFAQEQAAPLGYLPYMAPEQWHLQPLVPQTDVYQFAALLYELLAGQRPFEDVNPLEMQQLVMKEAPPPITAVAPMLPDQFDAIFVKALAKEPELRYASATALVQALQQAWQNHAFASFVYEGEKNYEIKQWDKAIAAYKQALKIRPNNQAVVAALARAERRKQDEIVLEQSHRAIEKDRWRDADYFLSQASDTPEKQALQKLVQAKIKVEQLYSEGRMALQQEDWLKAQTLLDEADSLEPNYRDVHALLGELAETIGGYLQQAHEAMANGDYDRALLLLEPVAELETAVTLRQEITEKQKKERRSRWAAWSRRRAVVVALLLLIAVGVAVVLIYLPTWRGNTEEPGFTVADGVDCLETAVPQLQLVDEDNDTYIIDPGETRDIPAAVESLNLSLLWPTETLSASCEVFVTEDELVEVRWGADAGGTQPVDFRTAVYQKLDSSVSEDTIVVTLSYDNQPLSYEYYVSFTP
ncbi:MAG: protein kinase [Anaerolineaceae bacterium]|nr:protein kinase [Anaerolineaceae bacterium]